MSRSQGLEGYMSDRDIQASLHLDETLTLVTFKFSEPSNDTVNKHPSPETGCQTCIVISRSR